MIRTFRYPLRPTVAQTEVLARWLGMCCDLYNGALQHRRDAWRKQRANIGYNQQTTELTELRGSDPEWAAVSLEAQRSALARLDRAFKAFFRRLKSGAKPGFPRFRSRHRYDSFGIGRIAPAGKRVRVPKLGSIKFHEYRPLRGKVLSATVGRDARGWYVSFACDIGAAPPKVAVHSVVGVDVGIESLATLSTGEHIENPRYFREGEATLKRRQQALARRRRGSRSRQRARRLVARARLHVRNQRLDYARKVAIDMVGRFDLIAHEDLNIRGMVHGNLAKSIHDAAWGQLIRCIQLKAEEAGKWVVPVDPRGTSQRCPACGETKRKALSEREHRCACGFTAHRDHAAALNVLALGVSAVEAA